MRDHCFGYIQKTLCVFVQSIGFICKFILTIFYKMSFHHFAENVLLLNCWIKNIKSFYRYVFSKMFGNINRHIKKFIIWALFGFLRKYCSRNKQRKIFINLIKRIDKVILCRTLLLDSCKDCQKGQLWNKKRENNIKGL